MKNATNFSKECPSCKKILYYKSIYYLNSSIKKNSLCQSCFAKERAKSKEYREKLSNGVKKSWIGADDRKKEQSQNSKSYWKNLSEEDRKLICKKMSENFNRSEDRIKNLKEISKNFWADESFREKWKKANSTPEVAKKRRDNIIKQHRDPNSKINSEEVKLKKISNFKNNWKNKSVEEKNSILENLAKTLHIISGTSKLELNVAKNISHLGFKSKGTVAGYCIDIMHETLPIIVEVNGDFWHANPSLYESSWVNNVNKRTAQEIWDRDAKRLQDLKDAGYDVIVLWQKDIKNNKNYVSQIEDFVKNYLTNS